MHSEIPWEQRNSIAKRTQYAFILMRLLCTPCWCLMSMLLFILYKNSPLTSLQIAIIVALKPTSSLLSPYWSHAIYQRPDKIISNLFHANFFRHFPFLFIPLINSTWFVIFSFGLYMMLTRATYPAWMELFKCNLPKSKPEQLVAYATTIDYLGTAILAAGAGLLLDNYQGIWPWLFSITSGFGILSSFLLYAIPIFGVSFSTLQPRPSLSLRLGLKDKICIPWKQVWQLICNHKDFSIFQAGFMLGGSGLMILQPALPQLFIDILHLSFVEMGLAISLCKGIGVALSSYLWTRLFRRLHFFQLGALVTLFATIFPFFLLASSFHSHLVYLAYAFYGIMQAGSELTWHMSSLVFAKERDSSIFSITNVLTVGMRGCIVPAIGSMLLLFIHPSGVLLVGGSLCLLSSLYFFRITRRNSPNKQANNS